MCSKAVEYGTIRFDAAWDPDFVHRKGVRSVAAMITIKRPIEFYHSGFPLEFLLHLLLLYWLRGGIPKMTEKKVGRIATKLWLEARLFKFT